MFVLDRITLSFNYVELPFCSVFFESVEREGGIWLRGGVPSTTSSRGSRGGRDFLKAATTWGSRLVVEDTLMAFSALSFLSMSPPGRDRLARSALGMGRSRE